MKTLNVLLGSSDRAAINRIEALVLDLCFERALVECRKSALLDDFERLAVGGWMDLIIFSPDNLLASPTHRAPHLLTTCSTAQSVPSSPQPAASQQVITESLRSVQLIRKQKLVPVVAFGVSEPDKAQVIAAGVDVILGPLWDSDQLKAELAQVLHLPLRIENPLPPNRWHFFSSLMRGFATAKSKA